MENSNKLALKIIYSIIGNVLMLPTHEQYTIINSQIENIFASIFNVNKFYSTLLTSVIGATILLCTNKLSTNCFDYLYCVVMLVYAISICWYKTLIIHLYDLDTNTKKYNLFIRDNKIFTMYNLSTPINIKRCTLFLPLSIGIFCLVLFC